MNKILTIIILYSSLLTPVAFGQSDTNGQSCNPKDKASCLDVNFSYCHTGPGADSLDDSKPYFCWSRPKNAYRSSGNSSDNGNSNKLKPCVPPGQRSFFSGLFGGLLSKQKTVPNQPIVQCIENGCIIIDRLTGRPIRDCNPLESAMRGCKIIPKVPQLSPKEECKIITLPNGQEIKFCNKPNQINQ